MGIGMQGQYDVAILGTGIGGTILGALLARNGVRVILLEQGTHPRFAIGESTVPETTFFFRVLAERYGVPEIGYLANYQKLHRHVGASHGVKRNFSFIYHRPQQEPRPLEMLQFLTAAPPLGPDVHLYRQDVDAFLLNVAISYGAEVRQQVEVVDVEIDDQGVRLKTRAGATINARYFVDAGGMKSMLARKLNLRVEPCPHATRSRSVYTHMFGVTPYDVIAPRSAHGLSSPIAQGTLQHLFDGGWIWVIPFNNHPTSTNPLVSVGMNLNIDRHGPASLSPQEEFRKIIGHYPGIAKQFERAVPVRDWVATERLQFLSTRAIGDRWAMLPHAFSFIDPLFSSGLGITMSAIYMLTARLIEAAKDGDFSAARFEIVDTWIKRNFRFYDRLVSGAYDSWRDFDLWNAWLRMWMLSGLYGGVGVLEVLHRCQQASGPEDRNVGERYPYRGVQASELEAFATFFDGCEAELDAVRRGEAEPSHAAARIFDRINASGLWPAPWGKATPENRCPITFTMVPLLRTGLWMRNETPDSVRGYYFKSARVSSLLAQACRDWAAEVRHAGRAVTTLTRDIARSWNRDWES